MPAPSIDNQFDSHLQVIQAMKSSGDLLGQIAQTFITTLKAGGKVLLCGNGGSAADAQHVAAELVCRYRRNRAALPAIALTTDSSILTAVGNDFDFADVFARQVEALATRGDIVVGISTSGKSPNVLKALEAARRRGARTIGFTGKTGGPLAVLCDLCFEAPATETARIQEAHLLAWHIICEIVEGEWAGLN
jgi:D-sedoheptulose 7-phosphate isomerase